MKDLPEKVPKKKLVTFLYHIQEAQVSHEYRNWYSECVGKNYVFHNVISWA